MIITITLNPAVDKSVTIPNFTLDRVNRITDIHMDAGGKGINISKVIHALGGNTLALGFLGGTSGKFISSELNSVGIDSAFIPVSAPTRTNLKVFDPVNHTYTDINELGVPLTCEAIFQLETLLFSRVHAGDTVVFAGGAPSGFPDDVILDWIRALKCRDVNVAVDFDGARLKASASVIPFLIKPNEYELQELCALKCTSTETFAFAAAALVASGIAHVIVSMGARGALFADAEGVLLSRGPAVEAVSTVGAGDALLAAMLYTFELGLSRVDAAAFAIATATAKVTCPGSSAPSLENVQKYINQIEVAILE